MRRVEASPERLMEQAAQTAAGYMGDGVEAIDRAFGKGYAVAHPELVAAFMQTCALDYATGHISGVLQDLGETLSESISSLSRE